MRCVHEIFVNYSYQLIDFDLPVFADEPQVILSQPQSTTTTTTGKGRHLKNPGVKN